MTSKHAVAKEQDSSGTADPLVSAADKFRAALEECIQTADQEAVHRVRTGSRRVQAMLEAILRENQELKDPGKRWLQELKRIRRAAGEVRDLDVHRKLLEMYAEKQSPQVTEQAKRLDDWLSHKRHRRAHRMVKQMRKRQQSLAHAQETWMAALPRNLRSHRRSSRSPETIALEDFVRAVDKMPVLDAENLHDFRKATKKARYVAESGAINHVSKALKRVQDSIGEWHDWLCLLQEATSALDEKAPELQALLQHQVQRHFQLALKTTQTMRARLTGEWMSKRPPRPVAAPRIAEKVVAGK
jgi:CHAD domain-containing protein